MSQTAIKDLLIRELTEDGLFDTCIPGVQLFRFTEPKQCAPVVYVPTVIAIVGGTKKAILDGQSTVYDNQRYMCCTMTMPVEAGISSATPENPLLGVSISIDIRMMTEMALELNHNATLVKSIHTPSKGLTLSSWDTLFADSLWRLVEIANHPEAASLLGMSRLREVYYSVLKGDAGTAVRQVFGMDNGIHRAIRYLSAHYHEPISIDDITSKIGMSRAVFHRKFKEATKLSPIQFVKAMRLNNAAMLIAKGHTINEAATTVGYTSSSQFSRDFKRSFGASPKQWSLHR